MFDSSSVKLLSEETQVSRLAAGVWSQEKFFVVLFSGQSQEGLVASKSIKSFVAEETEFGVRRMFLSFFPFVFLHSLQFLNGASSVQVVRFQPDGVARQDTVGVYKGKLDREWKMSSVSFCTWFQIFFLHGRDTFFQLRDDEGDLPYMIKGELWVERYRPAIAARWNFQMFEKKLKTKTWYHLCFTYNHEKTRYESYLNGKWIDGLDYDITRQIWGDYAHIGQGGEISESFSGELSQMNVWDYVLTEKQIEDLSNCQSDLQGNYIAWNKGWVLSNVEEFDVPLTYFCNQERGSTYTWFSDEPYTSSYYLCESLGAHLPLPKNIKEAEAWLTLAERTWGNETRCTSELITSINDIENEGSWARHYDDMIIPLSEVAWSDGEPNGLIYENCAQIESFGVADIDCKTRVQCAVCEFKDLVVYSFLGTCEFELRNINFLAIQDDINQLRFRGYGEYSIRFTDGEWKWMNEISGETIATMVPAIPNYPMGRRVWNIKRKVCQQVEGERTFLLTPCNEDQYSCDDASCIPLDYRCDLKYDCQDHSDEVDCNSVLIPDDYKNELPPRQNERGGKSSSLPISMKVDIESISVDTTDMQMQVSHVFQLTWIDTRLTFINLKVNDSLNNLPFTTLIKLWNPKVSFVNTEGNQYSEITPESTMFIKRIGEPSRRDDSAPAEIDLYPGIENTLTIYKKYSTKFVCDFELVLYPFDDQHCDMHLRIISASTAYLLFDFQNSFAEYFGSELLVEYTIGKPYLLNVKDTEFSEIRVRVPLKRLYGYAILNIYTPSLILITISYVTLYFRAHIFEVRVMTALTSLLVVATLFTQVSASLPKTSYFKMVDVWLLFCIAIIFITIVFHAIIDYVLEYEPVLPLKMGLGKFTKVSTINGRKVSPRGELTKDDGSKETFINSTAKLLILTSKVTVFVLFAFFNVLYWGIILSY